MATIINATAKGRYYSLGAYQKNKNYPKLIQTNINGSILSTAHAGDFTGSYIGIYASNKHTYNH